MTQAKNKEKATEFILWQLVLNVPTGLCVGDTITLQLSQYSSSARAVVHLNSTRRRVFAGSPALALRRGTPATGTCSGCAQAYDKEVRGQLGVQPSVQRAQLLSKARHENNSPTANSASS
jgi:hypothetical protein